MEVLDPAGNSQVLLVARPGGALLLDPVHRRFESYPSGADAVAALVGTSAPPDLLALLLLGPLPAASSTVCVVLERRAGGEPARCHLAGGGELVFGEPPTNRAELISADGDLRLDFLWERRSGQPQALPQSLEILRHDSERVLRLDPVEILFSAPAADLFSLEPPAGFVPGPGEADW